MSIAVERYYSVAQLAILLDFAPKTIRDKIIAGAFGDGVLKVDADSRIPVSGIRFFESNNRLFAPDLEPIAARTEGELRRKLAA